MATSTSAELVGRAGAFVDNLSLIGAELMRVSGTAVTAVDKSAGRGSRSTSVSA
jgi:hypothetical protein